MNFVRVLALTGSTKYKKADDLKRASEMEKK